MSSFTVANASDAFLTQHDGTAVSFWIISIAMIAATVFIFAEASTVAGHFDERITAFEHAIGVALPTTFQVGVSPWRDSCSMLI